MIVLDEHKALKAVEQRCLPKMREYVGDLRRVKAVEDISDGISLGTISKADKFGALVQRESSALVERLKKAKSRADAEKAAAEVAPPPLQVE